jgi:hypothetical protein
MKNPPRYGGRPVEFLYKLALFADDHISRRLGLDLEQMARDVARHNETRDKECRSLRRAAEEMEVLTFKHIK